MIRHYHELLRVTANDGASASTEVAPPHPFEEPDQLLEAWCRERQERIETELFLEEARRLLEEIMDESHITTACRRKARRLFLAIEAAKLCS